MSGIEARRAQAIKDYKLTVEYKHLKPVSYTHLTLPTKA